MFASLLRHQVDVAAIILRFTLAAVFIVHGFLKVAVGNESTSELVAEVSPSTMFAVGWIELLCGLALGFGLFTRVAALILIVIQIAAITVVSGNVISLAVRSDLGGRAKYLTIGAEFNLALIGMCLALIALGAGMASVDHVLATRWRNRRPAGVRATGPVSAAPAAS